MLVSTGAGCYSLAACAECGHLFSDISSPLSQLPPFLTATTATTATFFRARLALAGLVFGVVLYKPE